MDTGKEWRVVLRESRCSRGSSAICEICGDEWERQDVEARIEESEGFVVRDGGVMCLACLSNGQERALERLHVRADYWLARAKALLALPSPNGLGAYEQWRADDALDMAEAAQHFGERLVVQAEHLKMVQAWPSADDLARWQAEIELERSRNLADYEAGKAERREGVRVRDEDIPF